MAPYKAVKDPTTDARIALRRGDALNQEIKTLKYAVDATALRGVRAGIEQTQINTYQGRNPPDREPAAIRAQWLILSLCRYKNMLATSPTYGELLFGDTPHLLESKEPLEWTLQICSRADLDSAAYNPDLVVRMWVYACGTNSYSTVLVLLELYSTFYHDQWNHTLAHPAWTGCLQPEDGHCYLVLTLRALIERIPEVTQEEGGEEDGVAEYYLALTILRTMETILRLEAPITVQELVKHHRTVTKEFPGAKEVPLTGTLSKWLDDAITHVSVAPALSKCLRRPAIEADLVFSGDQVLIPKFDGLVVRDSKTKTISHFDWPSISKAYDLDVGTTLTYNSPRQVRVEPFKTKLHWTVFDLLKKWYPEALPTKASNRALLADIGKDMPDFS